MECLYPPGGLLTPRQPVGSAKAGTAGDTCDQGDQLFELLDDEDPASKKTLEDQRKPPAYDGKWILRWQDALV